MITMVRGSLKLTEGPPFDAFLPYCIQRAVRKSVLVPWQHGTGFAPKVGRRTMRLKRRTKITEERGGVVYCVELFVNHRYRSQC